MGTFTGKGQREQETKKISQGQQETATTPSSPAPGPELSFSRVRVRTRPPGRHVGRLELIGQVEAGLQSRCTSASFHSPATAGPVGEPRKRG